MTRSTSPPSAESEYREAFERLKRGATLRLPQGSPVTQNNVAREANRDPSALKKGRYPRLIREIKAWIEQHPARLQPSPRQSKLAARRRTRSLKERIRDVKTQRDLVSSKLLEADARILELMIENARLTALVRVGE